MSAVIDRAKKQHLNAIKWESGLIFIVFCVFLFVRYTVAISFLAGALSAFIPHCIFVYWVFFKSAKNQQKVTAFYRGEGIKWVVAICLIAISFYFISELALLFFFVAYISTLMLNIVLPIIVNRQAV